MTGSGRRRRTTALDLAALVAATSVVAGVLVVTYAVHDYRFPVGADAAVYMWWARLAGQDGLGAVAGRPGIPGLTLLLSGALGAGTATVVAALEVALTAAAAAAAAALTMRPDRGRTAWLLPAVLSGCFAVFLAIGYVSTLAAAVAFLAACAVLVDGGRAGAALAAAMLAAQGLAHPQFLAMGVTVLLVWAGLSFLRRRSDPAPAAFLDTEHGRIVAAAAAGGLGLVALLALIGRGASPLRVDTSRDDVLQRLGLGSQLAGEFRDRLITRAPPLVPELTVPLAVWGAWTARDGLGGLLRGWGAVLAGGAVVAFVTGAFPAERFVTFGFVIPIAAGTALAAAPGRIATGRGIAARVAVWAGAGAVTIAVAAGALLVWFRTPPQVFPLEVERVTEASRTIEALPAGTPLVFVAKNREPVGAFFATEAANAIRAAVPPDRIRDVLVVVPAGPPLAPARENDLLTADELRAAAADPAAVWFDLAPFDRTGFGRPLPGGGPPATPVSQGIRISGGHAVAPVPAATDPLLPTSTREVALTAAAILVLATVAGSGWTAAVSGGAVRAIALSPAAGVGLLILAAALADLLGLHVESRPVALGLVAAVALGGHAAAILMRRRRSGGHDGVPSSA